MGLGRIGGQVAQTCRALGMRVIGASHHPSPGVDHYYEISQLHEMLPLAEAFEINETKTGRRTSVLHSFYRLDDGSRLVQAASRAPGLPRCRLLGHGRLREGSSWRTSQARARRVQVTEKIPDRGRPYGSDA